ncbi:MAG: PQQ-binding-like beta-propeller repeat protein [Planctomycetota bacterium]
MVRREERVQGGPDQDDRGGRDQEGGATGARPVERGLRLWPGFVLVAAQWLARFGLPEVAPDALPFGVMAGPLGALAVGAWWCFFSRAPRGERWIAAALVVLALAATPLALDVSVSTSMQGLMFPVYATPVLSALFVAWAAFGRRLAGGARWAALVVVLVLACVPWALVRTGGFTGDLDHDFAWRWSKTPEELLLEADDDLAVAPTVADADAGAAPEDGQDDPGAPDGAEASADEATAPAPAWPGFRGPARDGVARGVRFGVDWSAAPPVELWRRAVGPGWSSFAVDGARLYTQEQRGEEEAVSCYDLATGAPLWRHVDTARFWESNAGAGPRGTPALGGGRVYALGATGILNALEAADGTPVWSRDAAADTGAELPGWGFSGSPLLVDDLVVVAVAGELSAYDRATGEPRWSAATGGGGGYSSAQLLAVEGVEQIVFTSADGVTAVAPADGTRLWAHAWSGDPIVQPALTADGDVLVSVDRASGVRRLDVTYTGDAWTVTELWTSIRLKPYYNHFVVHDGHAYGFDGGILACIDLAQGKRRWKGGRYGRGQMLLAADQDTLVVLSEAGEVALVAATPDGFTELALFQAIEGKTWNHPVVVGDVLVVRNAEEMAAFRLPAAGG